MDHLNRRRRRDLFAALLLTAFVFSPATDVAAEEDPLKPTPAAGNEAEPKTTDEDPDSKFAFALADLGTGSRPDAAGVPRPLGYEYCIPKTGEAIMMVGNTDPTGMVNSIRTKEHDCAEEELLATGHTGQPDYLTVLRAIAKHDFIKKIVLVEQQ